MTTEKIERRLFLRLDGDEAEWLLEQLQNGLEPRLWSLKRLDYSSELRRKLMLALGRAERVAQVIQNKPVETLAQWEAKGGRLGQDPVRRQRK